MNWSRYSTISFDIFDTLIKRRVANPSDIFLLVEYILDKEFQSKTNFSSLRIEAKKRAKQKNRYYNIDDVYKEINLNNVIKKRAEQLEKQVEIKISYPNREIVTLFDECVKAKKPVFLISDMYLDRDTIEKILSKCKICGYRKLYISQEIQYEKLYGGLYKKFIQENHIDIGKHIHIGDNKKSDIVSAKMCGFHTRLVDMRGMTIDYNSKTGLSHKEKRDYALIQANITAGIGDIQNEWERIGYECLGPILWGFSNWLANDLRKSKISKVFFLSREGEILKNAFELLHPSAFKCHYLYVSRRSLTVPSFYGASSFDEVIKQISFPKNITVFEFLNYIGVDSNIVMPEIKNIGLKDTDKISGWHISEDNRIRNLYSLIRDKAERVFEEQNNYINRYFNQEDLNGKVAVVDIGWNGTMQSALERIIKNADTEIKGYYFGVNEKNKLRPEANAAGYIYEPGKNIDYQYYIMGISGPLEMMTTAHHGTTLAYSEEENEIVPVLGESEYFGLIKRSETDAIDLIQKGAICFVKQMKEVSLLSDIIVSGKAAFQNFYLFGTAPLAKHRQMFYGMKEYDSSVELTLLDPSTRGLKGDNSIINGFWNSSWKIGYMRDKFKIPLPYAQIYKALRKRKR